MNSIDAESSKRGGFGIETERKPLEGHASKYLVCELWWPLQVYLGLCWTSWQQCLPGIQKQNRSSARWKVFLVVVLAVFGVLAPHAVRAAGVLALLPALEVSLDASLDDLALEVVPSCNRGRCHRVPACTRRPCSPSPSALSTRRCTRRSCVRPSSFPSGTMMIRGGTILISWLALRALSQPQVLEAFFS